MACYALTSLIGTIDLEFLRFDSRISLDDECFEAAKSLFENLSSLNVFLSETWESGGGYTTAAIRDCDIKIRDFALKAEDDIEMLLSNILLEADGDTDYHEELNSLLKQLAEDAEELLNILNNESNDEPQALVPIHVQNVVSDHDGIMVGRHHKECIDMMKERILKKRQVHEVSPIFGMPGIGKTCVAKSVYKDPLVASSFDAQAWVTVSHDYNEQRIQCELLRSMMPTIQIEEGITLSELKDQIFEHLKDKRYLIVLDDVWSAQDYNAIQKYFPKDPCGSYQIVTTQFYEVNAHCLTQCFLGMSLLDAKDSWDLFNSRLSLKEPMTPKFEKIAKRVVYQCQGLPRSIVAVAKRLSECDCSLKEWKKIEKEVEALGALYRDAEYSSKLTLIYNQLPQHIRVCFLYFAIFPKDTQIQASKLIRLWIVEGFVKPQKNIDLEDVADGYIYKLFDCSLIISDKTCNAYPSRTYLMHGAIHSFCTREAQKEGLLCAINTRQCLGWSLDVLGNSCRWLSLRSHSLNYYVFFCSNTPRSFFFFNGDPEKFVPFRLLRTVDFSTSPIMLKRLPLMHLEDLVFLRYLSVPHWFEGLDYIVSRNKNLQVLIISGVESKPRALALHLPSRIWESPQLRHLDLGNLYTVDPPSMVKEHLTSLSWVSTTRFGSNVYCKFPNMKELKIFYTCTHGGPWIIFEDIGYLESLDSLTIVASVGNMMLLQGIHAFPKHLLYLHLEGTNFSVKVLGVIGQLSKLEVLKLDNAFYGRVWEVAQGGFPSLRRLMIESRNLEHWIADATHFPSLRRLSLRRCYCLKEIPCGFVEIPMFWKIKINKCPASVLDSATWIRGEVRKRHRTFIIDEKVKNEEGKQQK